MKKSKRFTVVVLTVAVLLAATGIGLYVFVPAELAGRGADALALRTKSTADYVAAYAQQGLLANNRGAVTKATEIADVEDGLAYAVVVGDRGEILASATSEVEVGQMWADWAPVFSKRDIEEVSSAVVIGERIAASVHVGVSRAAMKAGLQKDRKVIGGFSAFLILLALGAGFGVFQMERLRSTAEEWQQRHKSVRLQAGNLYSSVREHRENERNLKQSESKYKSLFESTMASAMADLEELNRHLERRKADLEHEVGVRKKAEVALRRYTQRLQLLNAVERSLLEGKSVKESASLALRLAIELVPAVRLNLVESNLSRGVAEIVGLASKIDTGRKVGDAVPMSSIGSASEISHVGDLEEKEELSPTEKVLLAEGVRSYVDVPMVVQSEVVGVLCMESTEVRAFSDEHFSIARDVADLLAIGIHRARLDQERELYEEELVLERDRAEDMARLKTAFLTNMSHEIRTPISGIMGFSQVLHEEVPDGLREFTGLIQESAHRLLNTINSVLELARLESGKSGLELVRLDVAEEVKQAAVLLDSAAKRKGLDFKFEAPTEPMWCNLDRGCVERIVTNLVDNAIKFTDGGAVRVSVTEEAGRASICVTDTGVGIAKEFIPLLFDEFRQEQMDANREHEGSGLGLTITKKLVDRQGGTIEVKSKKGVGTMVTVQFDLIDTVTGARRDATKVLLVTGSADAAQMLANAAGPDFQMAVVETPKEAVELSASREWKALLLDVNSAAAHEVEEAARRLARKLGSACVLGIATQILPKDPERLLRAGFGAFITEPYEPGVLAEALESAMAAGPRVADGPSANRAGDRGPVAPERHARVSDKEAAE